jgi:hypothetical protein
VYKVLTVSILRSLKANECSGLNIGKEGQDGSILVMPSIAEHRRNIKNEIQSATTTDQRHL